MNDRVTSIGGKYSVVEEETVGKTLIETSKKRRE